MKALILYFSQTQNTFKIATCICEGMRTAADVCDIKTINEADMSALSGYDMVGIGAPVFYYKEPFHVQEFLLNLPELDGQHWFVFCTHGTVFGNFFPSVVEKLEKKGAMVIGCHHSYANITLPFYPKPSYTEGHPDEKDFIEAHAFGQKMIDRSPRVKNKSSILNTDACPVSSARWIKESHKMTLKTIGRIFPKLHLEKDTCIQCHECEDQCPVNGIDMDAYPPRIQDPCIYCWRCVNICPTLSIAADWTSVVSFVPVQYARYKEELDRMTEQGHFRWLIDPADIQFDDPIFKQRERELKSKKK